jgi:chromate reductase
VKSQLSLQIVLGKLGVHVIPNSFALGAAHPCFDAEGGLKDADVEKAVRGVGAVLAEMAPELEHPAAAASPRRPLI